ncbi:MAG: hypothetical protein IPN94_03195 [Sphingobacteriales bacterium]|nr:hypothetical protein [Sphingobacteriales bacterium]
MKNLFLLVFVILVAGSTLYAQIQKGIVRLGGTFIADYSDNTINNRGLQLFSLSTAPSIYFNITPNVGVFISNKWLVGGSIGYDYYKDFRIQGKHYLNKISLSADARYHKKITEQFWGFINISASSSYSNEYVEFTDDTGIVTVRNYEIVAIAVFASPGLLYFINNRVSVEATLGSLGYRHYYSPKIITINPFRKDNDYAGLNVSGSLLNLGINYYFVKKQK